MHAQTVPITAEWALWGKERSDAGYRVLACSDGTIGIENFDEVLTRYSPGTLEFLPQVTISWVADKENRHYVAIAIHDRADRALYDVSGRAVVMTSYFCVPYNELAAGAVSYYAMYDHFRAATLPVAHRARIQAALPVAGAAGRPDGFAMRAAALLLTGKPVCILRADGLDVSQRLMFIETVMSLLPYGMRSRFSASTWASSTFQEHRLRLFFASARRQADDHVMVWGQADHARTGHIYADDYLVWLREATEDRINRLTQDTEQAGFRQADILKMLERMGVAPSSVAPAGVGPSGGSTSGGSPVGPARGGQPGEVARWNAPSLQRAMTVDELLFRCADRLQHADPFLTSDIARLEEWLGDAHTPEERHRYYLIIKEHGLLREEKRISKGTRKQFYDVLLRLAFGAPLTYASFCKIESCLGTPPVQVHRSLLVAINAVGVNVLMRLLVLGSLGEKELKAWLREQPETPADLISAAADPGLRPDHARIVCELAVHIMIDQVDRLDHQAIRAALHRNGYLAAVLQLRHPAEPQYQLSQLSQLLYLGHGAKLGTRDVEEILDSCTPTIPLLAAVLLRSGPRVAQLTEWLFVRRLVMTAGFSTRTQRDLISVLSANEHPGNEHPGEDLVDTVGVFGPEDGFERGWRARLPFRGRFREDP